MTGVDLAGEPEALDDSWAGLPDTGDSPLTSDPSGVTFALPSTTLTLEGLDFSLSVILAGLLAWRVEEILKLKSVDTLYVFI